MTGTLTVSVLLLHEEGGWVAQCLEVDVAAQGKTIAEAKSALERTFVGQIVLDLKNGRQPLEAIGPAPGEYWEMFNRGERLADRQPFYVPPGLPPAYMISAAAAETRINA